MIKFSKSLWAATILSNVFAIAGAGAAPVRPLPAETTRSAARAVAAYMNSFASYDEFFADLKKFIPQSDFNELQNQFARLHEGFGNHIPKMTAQGSTIHIANSQEILEFAPDASVILNGKKYKNHGQSTASGTLKEMIDLFAPKTAGLLPSLITAAEAADPAGAESDAIGAGVATAMVGSFVVGAASPFLFSGAGVGLGSFLAVDVSPVLAIMGASIWVGKEVYESAMDGTVDCNGKDFEVRKKTRGRLKFPTNKTVIVDFQAAKAILKNIDLKACTPATAAQLQSALADPNAQKQLAPSVDGTQPAGAEAK